MIAERTTPLTTYYYPISSGDMRHIAVGGREVILHGDKTNGFTLEGQLSGSPQADLINLSEILVEEAMSLVHYDDVYEANTSMAHFAKGLGRQLAKQIVSLTNRESAAKQRQLALNCIVNSLGEPFKIVEHTDHIVSYEFESCPITAAARRIYLLSLPIATYGLYVLLKGASDAIENNAVQFAIKQTGFGQLTIFQTSHKNPAN